MSVYTTLSLAQVQEFAAPYGLEVIELIPIQAGIQNTNYFLKTIDHKQYVLTVFEEMDEVQAGEIVPVLDRLQQYQLPVAVPLKYQQRAIHHIAAKAAQIAPRLEGKHPEQASILQIEEIARAQATMHVALRDFPLQRQFSRDHQYWKNVAYTLKQNMSEEDAALLQQVLDLFQQTRERYPNRPQGFIHSDLFRDNTLFQGDELVGILDFYELNYDELLFDLAISINDFCTEYPTSKLNTEKFTHYVAAYTQVRALTEDEKVCLPVYLAVVACRFWLMRLSVAQKNQAQGRNGDDILFKNPLEMRAMVVNRLQAI
ncbi:homoserine kinase [Acinetobacter rudis]|uniref:Homoserine kinase n=1 Tax=Acinetobacter rudis TaxID=632955 RepID=A0AAW8JBY9_9GAMM|nr:homoserine kinase [Acinetobacter rudis]MDQ8936100.1 homoserine kinase [Acinetobacter rudis]MDQ8952793.1 homoserine kinase [Acinetobacter rudis]MDQ9018363.1 homoserine kinase [Acinetobacter rudis]